MAIKVSGNTVIDNDKDFLNIRTATFNTMGTLATTTGTFDVDFSTITNYVQAEPTGAITYTFTAPRGPMRCQILIDSDGTSTAQTFTFPGTVIWYGADFTTTTANKKSVLVFFWDGTNFHGSASTQV